MTAIASDDTPEEWSQWDDIAVEVYSRIDNIRRLGDFNALVFFADELFLDDEDNKLELDEEDAITLRDFLDLAIQADTIIQKHLGPSYINDYIETIETEDTDE
jgi:hypothetical protein